MMHKQPLSFVLMATIQGVIFIIVVATLLPVYDTLVHKKPGERPIGRLPRYWLLGLRR